MRSGWIGGLLIAAVLVSGCRPEPEWKEVRSPPTQLPTTVSTTTVASTTTTTSLPSTVFPGEGLTDCVRAIQFGAFSGDDDLSAVWQSVGADVDRVRSYCRDLSSSDPVEFAALGEGWRAVEELSTTTVSAEPADPALVAACVARIRWGKLADDPAYVRVWVDLGSGSEFLDVACAELVLDDPRLVREMAAEVEDIERFLAASTPSTT